MPRRPPGCPTPPRSSAHLERRTVHVAMTRSEYDTVTVRAAIAGVSRPRYLREAGLAFQIFRTTSPAEVLLNVTRAIGSIRALARLTAASLDTVTRRHLEAAIAEIHRYANQLEYDAEHIAAELARRPGPTQPSLASLTDPT
jgi:hypothetical protein